MKIGKSILKYIIIMGLGIVLIVLGNMGLTDEYWSGMGCGLLLISAVRLVGVYRLCKNEEYKEKYETEVNDERNRFLRNKAWAWAGYLFIIIVGVSVIVLKLMGQELLSLAASYAVCLMLVLYWVAYLILKKKY